MARCSVGRGQAGDQFGGDRGRRGQDHRVVGRDRGSAPSGEVEARRPARRRTRCARSRRPSRTLAPRAGQSRPAPAPRRRRPGSARRCAADSARRPAPGVSRITAAARPASSLRRARCSGRRAGRAAISRSHSSPRPRLVTRSPAPAEQQARQRRGSRPPSCPARGGRARHPPGEGPVVGPDGPALAASARRRRRTRAWSGPPGGRPRRCRAGSRYTASLPDRTRWLPLSMVRPSCGSR